MLHFCLGFGLVVLLVCLCGFCSLNAELINPRGLIVLKGFFVFLKNDLGQWCGVVHLLGPSKGWV